MSMEQFDLNKQWYKFLELSKLDEKTMPTTQRVEMKRAFYAGCGKTMVLMRDEVTKLSYGAMKAMDKMFDQVGQFWLNEQNVNN